MDKDNGRVHARCLSEPFFTSDKFGMAKRLSGV